MGRMALLVYAVYMVTNMLRANPDQQGEVSKMLYQGLLNGAQGHSQAMGLLREVWVDRRVRRRLAH